MNPTGTLGSPLRAGLIAALLSLTPSCRPSAEPGADSAAADAAVGTQATRPAAAAAATDAGVSTAPEPASDAGPTPAPARQLKVTAKAITAAEIRSLDPSGPNEGIDPLARLELELPPMTDVRVRLFDAADKAVPSSDQLQTDAAATRYILTPAPALAPASRYTLVVEGLEAPESTDRTGTRYEPLRIGLKTGGEPEKPAKKPAKKRRR